MRGFPYLAWTRLAQDEVLKESETKTRSICALVWPVSRALPGRPGDIDLVTGQCLKVLRKKGTFFIGMLGSSALLDRSKRHTHSHLINYSLSQLGLLLLDRQTDR